MTRAVAEVEIVGDEIWDTLSLLAQTRMEETEVEPERHINVMADERTCAVSADIQKHLKHHPLVERMINAGPSGPEVPFDERKNVILLREAYHGAMDFSLTKAQYREKMEQLFQLSTLAVAIFKNPRIKKEGTKLPEDQTVIVKGMQAAAERLKAGVDRMWKYQTNNNEAWLEAGFQEAEKAMYEMWVLQGTAARKEAEIDAQVEAGTYGTEEATVETEPAPQTIQRSQRSLGFTRVRQGRRV